MFYQSKIISFSFFLLACVNGLFASGISDVSLIQLDVNIANQETNLKYQKKQALEVYSVSLANMHADSVQILKKMALINAELNRPKDAFIYANRYILNSFDFKVFEND